LVEDELLTLISSDVALENKVGSVECENSVHWEHAYKLEWSIDVKTELFVESLDLLLELINVNKLPLLTKSVVSWGNLGLCGFLIFVSNNFKVVVVVDGDESIALHLPKLIRVGVDTRDLNTSSSSVTLEVKSEGLVCISSNGLGLTVEEEFLFRLTVGNLDGQFGHISDILEMSSRG